MVLLVTLMGFMMVTMKVDSLQVLGRGEGQGPEFEECRDGDDGDIGDVGDVGVGDDGDIGVVCDENDENQES